MTKSPLTNGTFCPERSICWIMELVFWPLARIVLLSRSIVTSANKSSDQIESLEFWLFLGPRGPLVLPSLPAHKNFSLSFLLLLWISPSPPPVTSVPPATKYSPAHSVQPSIARYRPLQPSTVPYSPVESSRAQYSPVQYSNVHHTWYLSFSLHGQNFWMIKFTPKNANFLH